MTGNDASAPVAYRAAGKGDWPAIRALLEACDLPLAGAEACLDHFVVAVAAGRIVGCAALEMRGDVALLRSLAVEASLRRRGVGAELVNRTIALARQRGLRQLVLLTTTAAHFFPRFGFILISRAAIPASLHDTAEFRGVCPQSATVMRLTLPPAQ